MNIRQRLHCPLSTWGGNTASFLVLVSSLNTVSSKFHLKNKHIIHMFRIPGMEGDLEAQLLLWKRTRCSGLRARSGPTLQVTELKSSQ